MNETTVKILGYLYDGMRAALFLAAIAIGLTATITVPVIILSYVGKVICQ